MPDCCPAMGGRVEYGEGPVQGVGAFRRTTHLGWEVVDRSGRHGWPEVVQVPGRGISYHWAEMEFAMGTTPKWVFTFEVGQNTSADIIGDINTLTMPQPPVPPDVQELDAWGRGPDSESDDGCDTETDSNTEDDEVLSRRGRYLSGYPFLQDTLASRELENMAMSVSNQCLFNVTR